MDLLSAKDFHILYALTLRPQHGYGLLQDVEERTDGTVTLEPANLYRRLHAFTEEGLIEPAEAPAGGEDGRRKYYRATEDGRRAVRAELERMGALVRDARRHGVVPDASAG